VLGDEHRLEAAVAVARHLHAQRTVVGEYGLAARAIAVVGGVAGLRGTGRIAQVMAELGAQRPLDQRLLESHRGGIDRLGAHGAAHELVNEFLGDRRQRRRGRSRRLRLAWHRCSWSSCYASHTKILTGSADKQSSHFFIDDPVSSLDDHNVFVTAATLYDLIENQFETRKIIVTTHHLGLFSILSDWITKGEKSDKFRRNGRPLYKLYILSSKSGDLELENCRNDVFLYHLRLLQVLSLAREARDVRAYHFALLRQVLENVASFLGVGQFSYVLNQIGIREPNRIADIVNALSHKKVYYYESDIVVPDNLAIFEEVMAGLLAKYNFVLHAE
jgi:hypothetical protein